MNAPVDWDAGSYESSFGPVLEPVAAQVVRTAGVAPGQQVLDLACGTGNVALQAARCGAQVIGVDAAARLLEVARRRAGSDTGIEFRQGDLAALPVRDGEIDLALSVFGLIFAADPEPALQEVRRVLGPAGRLVMTAWVPAGPLVEMRRAVNRAAGLPSSVPFGWHDPEVLGPVAGAAGLRIVATAQHRLPIRAASAAAYVDAQAGDPLQVRAGQDLRRVQVEVLDAANEDPAAFLVHSPYVLHELVGS
jgi:SAM-dependent methyltransferase